MPLVMAARSEQYALVPAEKEKPPSTIRVIAWALATVLVPTVAAMGWLLLRSHDDTPTKSASSQLAALKSVVPPELPYERGATFLRGHEDYGNGVSDDPSLSWDYSFSGD